MFVLKNFFNNASHEAYTVRDMQWNGIKNGVLLQLLKDNNFDCWIVVDKNIPYQQNIANVHCLISVEPGIVLDEVRNATQEKVGLTFGSRVLK